MERRPQFLFEFIQFKQLGIDERRGTEINFNPQMTSSNMGLVREMIQGQVI